MKKIMAENLKTSCDNETRKSEEIEKKKADFSLVKIELEEEEQKEKNLEWSPIRAETDSLITDTDSDSMDFTTSSDSSELSYSDESESSYSNEHISSIEPENFKEIVNEIKPIEDKPFKIVGIGMHNLGNTCFLNAVMQSFMHTVVLLQLFASIDHISPCYTNMNGLCMICLFRELVDFTMFYGRHFVIPERLVAHLSNFSSDFGWNQQQDAHEFLQCFLNKLESCCNIVKEAFGGRLVSKLRCCNCDHSSVTHEPLNDLSLEIGEVDSLPAALESFTRIEKLEFFCERCKTHMPVEKRLLIHQAPSVAVLHLKRFKNDGIVVQKVDKHVSFPLELDLLPYTNEINNEEMKYDLYAVIVHAGFSLSSGHYYTFIRCTPNEWYKYDDEKVLRVHEDVVLAEKAYIMFYANRGTPWFSDYIQIHKPFVDLHISKINAFDGAADETSRKPEHNKIEDDEPKEITLQTSSTPDEVYREDQLQEVEIKQACSRDEDELMDALHRGSHSMNDKKRRMEDSPIRDNASPSASSRNSKHYLKNWN